MVGQAKKLGLVFAVVLALGALVASAASANELVYRTCVKATKVGKFYTGKYNNKECTEENPKGEGKYEAQPVAEETTFTGKSKAAVITAAGKTITCKKSASAGEFVGEKASTLQIAFSGCGLTKKELCESPSAGAGVIKTSVMHAKLVYLNAAETEPGVLVVPVEPFAEVTCGASSFALEGRVLASLENTKKGMKLTFATSGGKQALQKFWVEEEEFGPFTLFTEPGEAEATLSVVLEDGPKGVSAA